MNTFLLVFALAMPGGPINLHTSEVKVDTYQECMDIGNIMVGVVQGVADGKALIQYNC